MKAVRVLLVGLGVVAFLVAVALIVALNSSFQTWLVRRELSKQPGLAGSVGEVSAGFKRVTLRDVHLESRGAVLTLPSLEADLPLVAAALSERVDVRRLVAKGWTLDLSKASNVAGLIPTTSSAARNQTSKMSPGFSLVSSAYAADAQASNAAAAAFRGVFADLHLPVDLSLDGVELEGVVILPPMSGNDATRAKLTLTGGGLAAGREGSFKVDVSGATNDGALSLDARLVATMDTPRTFTRVGAKADASVSGSKFPNGVKLNVEGEANRTANGEAYSLLLAGTEKQLAVLKADLVRKTARISGIWKLDLKDGDLAPFLFGQALPTFVALGEGAFETGTAFNEVHATGQLKASADRLEVVRPELSAVGLMNLTAAFDILQHGDSVRVEKFDGALASTAPVATLRALQPFEFNLKTAELRVADPAQDLVGLSLTGMPLAWARPLLGELVVTGGDMRGEFAASAREGGLALRARSPLTIKDATVSQGETPLLRNVDLSLNAAADYTPQGWQAQVVEFTIRHAGGTLLVADAKAGQLAGKDQALKATGRWSADLLGWLSQPAVQDKLQLAAGSAQGEFTASIDGTTSLETKVSLMNLIAVTKEKLPNISAELRADIASDHRVAFQAPIVFTQSDRKSDLLLTGTVVTGKPVSTIDGRLTGELVIVEDVKALALLLPGEKGPPKKPEAPGAPPAWNGFRGQLSLALKKVVYGGTYVVSDVAGTIRLEPNTVKFEGVQAMFGTDSDLKLAGGLVYDPAAKEPYSLKADVALNNFDTGAAFRAVNPLSAPTLEARVNLNGHISGGGSNWNDAAEKARGQFDVSSKGGVFRALATVLPTDKMQSAQSALSIVGGLLGGPTAETINATNEVVRMISEIQFDQLSVKAERGADLNLLLQDFTLISPNVRLGGVGQVSYQPGRSLLQQALDVRISMGARGRLGELLSQLKMLKSEKDNLGYTAFSTPIKIGGTLAQTDTSDLKTKLLAVALEKTGVGEAIDKFLGREKTP